MTAVQDEKIIEDALRIIDQGLHDLLKRELISTNEVADLLLDVRTMLKRPEVAESPEHPIEL
jgi:hypothetical protein